MLPYAMSLHDTYAEEDEDDLPDNQLSKTLELPTIEIQPHIKHDIYSATYYITPLISEITTSNQ